MGGSLGAYRLIADNVYPFFVWTDSSTSTPQHVYFSDPQHHRIYRTAFGESPTVVAGSGSAGYNSVTAGANTKFNRPHGVFGDTFYLYVCDTINYAVRRISFADNSVATIGKSISHSFYCFYSSLFCFFNSWSPNSSRI
jgi:hypothetical protein